MASTKNYGQPNSDKSTAEDQSRSGTLEINQINEDLHRYDGAGPEQYGLDANFETTSKPDGSVKKPIGSLKEALLELSNLPKVDPKLN